MRRRAWLRGRRLVSTIIVLSPHSLEGTHGHLFRSGLKRFRARLDTAPSDGGNSTNLLRNASMRRKSFERMDCPVALALESVGEWWSILILRDALQGYTRFDDFRQGLDISPTILTRRLNTLVDNGLL